MSNPANRLLTLVLMLQRQSNQKASDLAAALRVSVRTLHRYIGMLEEMGIPVYTERGPYGGFSLMRGYKMPPLIFSPEEATAVSLGTGLVEDMWGELYREAARSALAKLENLLPEQQREELKWARHTLVSVGLVRPGLDSQANTLTKLRDAMHNEHRVKMIYHSSSSATASKRKLDPYAITFGWGWWYVVGYCHTRRSVRTFRIDRIQDLNITDEPFQVPADFDVHEFMAQAFQGQAQVQVRLRFAAEASQIAHANRTAWETFEEQMDGSVVVRISAPDLNWAASTVLAYGPRVEVLHPPELRHLLHDWAQMILGLYNMKGE